MSRKMRIAPWFLILLSLLALWSRRGSSVPIYAARYGMQCGSCHFDPNGGGPRNEFGFNFAKSRHSLVPDTSGAWKDLTLVNRVGDNFPLYFGLNQRFLLLATQDLPRSRPDRLAFANMENDIHLAFQVHSNLTLVYTMYSTDAAGGTFLTNEAFGMVNGLPVNGYVKAGRFRTPFGLRMDDHTVATRNGYLDFINQQRFLPYDPRFTDAGIELGMEGHGIFGRTSFTNGSAPPVITGQPSFSEAKTVKVGYNANKFQAGLSLYDDFQKVGADPQVRFTRWGFYTLTHLHPFILVGEIAAGTDDSLRGSPAERRKNLLAYFVEANVLPKKWLNLRARFDQMDLDRSTDLDLRRGNTYYRYSVEGEVIPVPFSEVRWTFRYIRPQARDIPDERQAYLQLHFSY